MFERICKKIQEIFFKQTRHICWKNNAKQIINCLKLLNKIEKYIELKKFYFEQIILKLYGNSSYLTRLKKFKHFSLT